MSERKAEEDQDYEDLGRAIAGAMLEGGKSRTWALDLIKPLEFGAKDLDQWLVTYKRERYMALRWQKKKVTHRRQKIARLQERAEKLLRDSEVAEG